MSIHKVDIKIQWEIIHPLIKSTYTHYHITYRKSNNILINDVCWFSETNVVKLHWNWKCYSVVAKKNPSNNIYLYRFNSNIIFHLKFRMNKLLISFDELGIYGKSKQFYNFHAWKTQLISKSVLFIRFLARYLHFN